MAVHVSKLTLDELPIWVVRDSGRYLEYLLSFPYLGLDNPQAMTFRVGAVGEGCEFSGFRLFGFGISSAVALPYSFGGFTWDSSDAPGIGDIVEEGQTWTVTVTQTGYTTLVEAPMLSCEIGFNLGTGIAERLGSIRVRSEPALTPGRLASYILYVRPYEPDTEEVYFFFGGGYFTSPYRLPSISNRGSSAYDEAGSPLPSIPPPDPYAPIGFMFHPLWVGVRTVTGTEEWLFDQTAEDFDDHGGPTGSWAITYTDETPYSFEADLSYGGDYSTSIDTLRLSGRLVPDTHQLWLGADPIPAIDSASHPQCTLPFDVTFELPVNFFPAPGGGIVHGAPVGSGFFGIVAH